MFLQSDTQPARILARFDLIPARILAFAGLILLISCASQEPLTDETEEHPSPPSAVEGVQPYQDVITDQAITSRGVVDVHQVDESIYYEIPDSLLGRDFLMVSRVAKVPTDFFGFFSSGASTAEQVFIFERVRDQIHIRKKSFTRVAPDTLPIALSVRANNFEPIIASFDLETINPETGAVVIQINDFFENDVPAISGMIGFLRSSYQVRRLDPNRSYIDTVRTYPKNVEVRHVMTYEADNPPSGQHTNTLSVLMNQSMVLLPKEPMRPRLYDHRVGWFTINQVDFGLDEQKAAERQLIRRWRLEPSDPEAYHRGELVEPKDPIVWYIDPATPEEYREFVIKGIEDWNEAFETAGFKNAVIGKLPPSPEEDPDFTPEDIRYNMVRWVANLTRNAMGPSTSDPRTGEIIASDIVWYHNHIRSYRNRLMIETGAANPKARSLRVDEEYLGEAIRQVIAHEIGHALGLPHNMKANSSYPVDSLRSPTFTEEHGVSASVMDYARQNYIAQPEDGVERFIRKIGPYDRYSINWGYRIIPDVETPEDELETLNSWIIEKADDPMYRFGQSTGYDPSAQTEALGDNNARASYYGMKNLQRVVPMLTEWATRPGESYDDLEEIYSELVSMWNRYVHHVITNVGGVYRDRKSSGQEGYVYQVVPVEKQVEAMEFLLKYAFTTPEWILEEPLLRQIEHAGAVDRVRSLQGSHLRTLLSSSRMTRLIEAEVFGSETVYTLPRMLDEVRNGLFREVGEGESIDSYRRNLQRIYLNHIGGMADYDHHNEVGSDVTESDIRPLLRDELRELRSYIESNLAAAPDRMTQIHLEDLLHRIDDIIG